MRGAFADPSADSTRTATAPIIAGRVVDAGTGAGLRRRQPVPPFEAEHEHGRGATKPGRERRAVIDLRSLEVFYWVVELGGFGRAAERLHMTQPAVSARIGQVEAAFKARLVDRSSHRPPVPTPKGLELHRYAGRMLALRAELVAALRATGEDSGILRLGVAETLVHTLLGALVKRLHAEQPGVTPEITVDTSPNMRDALLAGELDLALMLGPLEAPRVRNVSLGAYDLAWVASPELAVGTGRLGLADLARWPILSYARGTAPHAELAELFGRPDLPAPRFFANASLSSMLRMALDGIGVGALPRDVIAGELASGALRVLDVEPQLAPLTFTAAYLANPAGGLARRVAELAGAVAAGR